MICLHFQGNNLKAKHCLWFCVSQTAVISLHSEGLSRRETRGFGLGASPTTEPTRIPARLLSLWAVSYIKVAQRETSTKKRKRETRKEPFDLWSTEKKKIK